jgi:precorrin-6B methylase 2
MYPGNLNRGLARFLTEIIRPKDFLEFGGGVGTLASHVARNCRVTRSYMIEPKIQLPPEPGLQLEALTIDITKNLAPRSLNRTFDLVLSIEVAEHIERVHHERLFDFLAARAGAWVVFSAARPGQGGHGHVAERPEAEWRDEFVSRGFTFDPRLTSLARSMSDRKNINHRRNLQVFRSPLDRDNLSLIEQAAAPHLDRILAIVRHSGDFLDGNLFYVNLAEAVEGRPSHSLRWKRENVVALSRNATRVLEVGFNAGHAALLMLLSNPALHITCVDRLEYAYTRACFDELAARFPGRLELVPGDSLEVLPRLARAHFDLVHLDGGKEKTIAADLAALRSVVSRDHVLVIDDTQNAALNAVVQSASSTGELDEFPFSEANARSRRSRWRHRIARFSRPDATGVRPAAGLRCGDEGYDASSIPQAHVPDGATAGLARATATAIRAIEQAGLDGAVVDVGAAFGHWSVLAALMASRFLPRDFYLFDDFEGFGTVPDKHKMAGGAIEPCVLSKPAEPESRSDAVRTRLLAAGIAATRLMIVDGPIESTVPVFVPERIAILRLAVDSHALTMTALSTMYDRLQPGGWLSIDGYGLRPGCREATDEYFARRGEIFGGTAIDDACFVLRK